MKEWWINVYQYPSGKRWMGDSVLSRKVSAMLAYTAKSNGCKLLYRLHVRLK